MCLRGRKKKEMLSPPGLLVVLSAVPIWPENNFSNALCREAGGFVTGLQNAGNKEICPVELGHRGTKSRNMGTVAADQYITAYMLSASQAFLKKLSAQRYKHMAWYEDASKVGTFEDGSV